MYLVDTIVYLDDFMVVFSFYCYQYLSNYTLFNMFLQAAFRALAGKGYQTLQSLLLDFCQWHPSEGLLNALLDMLVDGKFDIKSSPIIKVI